VSNENGVGPEDWYIPEPQPAGKPALVRRKWFMASGIGVIAIVGLTTVLVVSQTGASASSRRVDASVAAKAGAILKKAKPAGFQPTVSTPAGAARQTAQAFLTAWQSGNLKQAAAYTDDPAAAQSVLSDYSAGLHLRGLGLKPTSSTAAGLVGFSVSASVGTGGSSSAASATSATGTWSYTSKLTAYQSAGGWYVKWDPSLVAPNVSATVHPIAVAIKPGPARVTDADGNSLSASSQVALQNIAATMEESVKTTQGKAGLAIELENSSGHVVSGSTDELSQPVNTDVIKTTIDPTMETVATAAVGELPRSAMVVLQPSTGAILAVANSTGYGDVALTGTFAPGSSMKVVTTTGLLTDGMLPEGIDTPVGCPLVETVQGVKIHNSTSSPNSSAGTEDFEPNGTPFSTDFAQSCNNAFTQWWQVMDNGKLANAASDYYGLNRPWDIGLGSQNTYFSMPSDQSGSELAEELYGQGLIEANPLSMASVGATVDTGTFHQPYLVSGLTDMATATPLPSSVKSDLYTLMREVVTSGTAQAVGFGPGVYGKTGTAEAAANKDNYPNGWMVVFDPSKDIAVGCLVVDSNTGALTAGPEANYVLQHS
jgi:Penicillin binding protein transpeptidase domain/NTF2-like N-terminal transpeptidase domain